jgi:hypothetical protein
MMIEKNIVSLQAASGSSGLKYDEYARFDDARLGNAGIDDAGFGYAGFGYAGLNIARLDDAELNDAVCPAPSLAQQREQRRGCCPSSAPRRRGDEYNGESLAENLVLLSSLSLVVRLARENEKRG